MTRMIKLHFKPLLYHCVIRIHWSSFLGFFEREFSTLHVERNCRIPIQLHLRISRTKKYAEKQKNRDSVQNMKQPKEK